MQNDIFSELTIGEIVANDFRAAEIFKNAGIDFCCGGKNSLLQTCREKGIDPTTLEASLKALEETPQTQGQNYKEWDLDFLCDYIENTHHKYVMKVMPDLVQYTVKLASVHGGNHPELIAIANIFAEINYELMQHLKKEEEVLFPAIKKALKENSQETISIIISEIARMAGEHDFAGGAMDRVNVISQQYAVPTDGCNTYHVGFKLLHQFEDDLHVHVHLENNILYPKALALAN